jgi:restriction endonuclease HindI-like protein
MHRETARARMRVLVKRILWKYGYPPDLQDAAVQNVLQQAEILSAQWACARPLSLDRPPLEHGVAGPSIRLLLRSPQLR